MGMKRLSESRAIKMLQERREAFRAHVAENYEHRAKACATCETRGACCLDEHFVNVRVTRLEAAAMRKVIDRLPDDTKAAVERRIDEAIAKYGLECGGEKFACPLFDMSVGCLVHAEAKPFPCILHACYERKEDVPPGRVLDDAEQYIERLNQKVYGMTAPQRSIPLAIKLC